MASCDPRDERQHDSKDDEHDDGAGDVEAFVAQKNGEGGAIKEQAGGQNKIPRRSLRADCNVLHLFVGCNETSPWIQMKKNRGAGEILSRNGAPFNCRADFSTVALQSSPGGTRFPGSLYFLRS